MDALVQAKQPTLTHRRKALLESTDASAADIICFLRDYSAALPSNVSRLSVVHQRDGDTRSIDGALVTALLVKHHDATSGTSKGLRLLLQPHILKHTRVVFPVQKNSLTDEYRLQLISFGSAHIDTLMGVPEANKARLKAIISRDVIAMPRPILRHRSGIRLRSEALVLADCTVASADLSGWDIRKWDMTRVKFVDCLTPELAVPERTANPFIMAGRPDRTVLDLRSDYYEKIVTASRALRAHFPSVPDYFRGDENTLLLAMQAELSKLKARVLAAESEADKAKATRSLTQIAGHIDHFEDPQTIFMLMALQLYPECYIDLIINNLIGPIHDSFAGLMLDTAAYELLMSAYQAGDYLTAGIATLPLLEYLYRGRLVDAARVLLIQFVTQDLIQMATEQAMLIPGVEDYAQTFANGSLLLFIGMQVLFIRNAMTAQTNFIRHPDRTTGFQARLQLILSGALSTCLSARRVLTHSWSAPTTCALTDAPTEREELSGIKVEARPGCREITGDHFKVVEARVGGLRIIGADGSNTMPAPQGVCVAEDEATSAIAVLLPGYDGFSKPLHTNTSDASEYRKPMESDGTPTTTIITDDPAVAANAQNTFGAIGTGLSNLNSLVFGAASAALNGLYDNTLGHCCPRRKRNWIVERAEKTVSQDPIA